MSFHRKQVRAFSFLLLGTVIFMAGPATAAAPQDRRERLPQKYRDWLEKEVVYIIADQEREAFLELQTVGEWDAFIDSFWRRRDPDPLTPVNEFKEEHYRRIEYANRHLGRESPVPGWMTDRGKVYIILGEPDSREPFPAAVGFLYPMELWFYLAKPDIGLRPMYLLFFQEGHAGPYRIFNHAIDQVQELFTPLQYIDDQNPRMHIYRQIQSISPELAHAAFSVYADRGVQANILDENYAALETPQALAEIYTAPYRRLDTSWVNAAREDRGLVETDYLFNYIPSQAMVNVLPGPGGSSFVHYSIEIEPQHVTLVHDEDKKVYYTRLIVQGEVNTLDEQPVEQLTKDVFLNMTEAQIEGVAHRPFSYRDMFPLVPGEFKFRVVLKNEASKEYTLFETDLQVPQRPAARSSASMDVPVLLYGTEPDAGASWEYRTYQLGSLKLEPNTKRVYAIGDTLEVHVPVSHVGDGHQLSLRVVSQSDPTQTFVSSEAAMGDYAGAPVIQKVSLTGMVGGRYRLIAELRDPSGEVVASQSTDFEVTPRAEVLRPWIARETIEGENEGIVQSALAEQYLNLGEVSSARRASQRAFEVDPTLTAPRVHLGMFLVEDGNPQRAIEILEPAYAREPENAAVLLSLGDAYYRAKNYPKAAELLEASLVRRRPGTAVFNALAICYGQMGNREKVLQYLERSLELDPNQEPIKALKEHMESSPPPGND